MNIDNLGQEVASEMLDALMRGTNSIVENISRESKVEYIIDRIPSADADTLFEIGYVLIKRERWNDLHECNEGTVINLDAVGDDIINEMYDILITAPVG
ncbi:MAG: hypothetical protein WDA28_13125 [Castellaniella sp.]